MLRRISIVGAGRVGRVVAAAVVNAGYELAWVSSTMRESADKAVRAAGQGRATTNVHDVCTLGMAFTITAIAYLKLVDAV